MSRALLLVEDNPDELSLAIRSFERYRLENDLIIARDGEEALSELKKRFPSESDGLAAIILDLKMPRLDGMEVLRELRGNDRFQDVPVLVMISSEEARLRVEKLNLNVTGYIEKPLDFPKLARALAQIGFAWRVV